MQTGARVLASGAIVVLAVATTIIGVRVSAADEPCSSQTLRVHIVPSDEHQVASPDSRALATVRCWVQSRKPSTTPQVWLSSDDQFYVLHASVLFDAGRRVLLDLERSKSGWRIAQVSNL